MPAVWAIADFHLSFGVANKKMDVFGPQWLNHEENIKQHWLKDISPDDLILIAGDISWAMRLDDARPDLEWIHQLPGTKIMIKGNHDYWWNSLSQIEKICPPSIHLIQNNAFHWNGLGIAGARLWDTPAFGFKDYIDYKPNPKANLTEAVGHDLDEVKRIWEREINRLEMSLKCLKKETTKRLVMTHYPPISAELEPSDASTLLEKYQVDHCVFGHLHNVGKSKKMFGERNGVNYALTSCDYLDFKPLKLFEFNS